MFSKKGLTAAGIIAVIVILAGGIYLKLKRPLPDSEVTSSVTAPSESSKFPPIKKTGNSVDTSTWKAYTNAVYGFEFKYPSTGWSRTGASIKYIAAGQCSTEGDCIQPIITVGIETKQNPPASSADFIKFEEQKFGILDLDVLGFEQEKINGVGGYHIQWTSAPVYQDDVVIFHNGYEFTISHNFEPGSSGALGTIVAQTAEGLVSTFQFTK